MNGPLERLVASTAYYYVLATGPKLNRFQDFQRPLNYYRVVALRMPTPVFPLPPTLILAPLLAQP